MSDDYRRIELITGTARRRHWSTEQKLQIIEESLEPGETVSSLRAGAVSRPICCIAGGDCHDKRREPRLPRLGLVSCLLEPQVRQGA